MKKNGFTFIELIVVVTIVLILSLGAVISFAGGNKKARDSRRMTDLEKIRVALELYRQANGIYPILPPVPTPLPTGFSAYLDSWPKDPSTGKNYYYNRTGDYTYQLCSFLENIDINSASVLCGSNCGGLCYYRVTNP